MPQLFPISPGFPAIAIVGPTATGKSQLALALAEWWLTASPAAASLAGVDIISADSRQIYSGLEIISGADVPADYTLVRPAPPTWPDFADLDPSVQTALSAVWQKPLGTSIPTNSTNLASKTISLWGVATLPVTQAWSAAQFQVFGQKIIAQAQAQQRAVIVVGGTGLYQQLLWQKDWQISVPPDLKLRTQALTATTAELQAQLQHHAPERLAALNPSDRANPRRLIRQLELAAQLHQPQADPSTVTPLTAASLSASSVPPIPTLGLTRPLSDLPTLITARVDSRYQLGALAEATALDPATTQPAVLTTLGVKELRLLATDQLTPAEAKTLWARRELQYAKRQITWWKKRPGIHWLDATQPDILTACLSSLKLNPTST